MYSIYSRPIRKVNFFTKVKLWFGFGNGKQNLNDIDNSYQLIVQNLDQLVCKKDIEGRYTLVNQVFCDFAGKPEEKILGKDDAELGLFLNPLQIKEADAKVFSSMQKKHIPIEPFTDQYGGLHWFKTTKTPLFDSQNRVIEVLIISTDISKKVILEQKLLKSESRYKSIFENNYSGIIVVNQELEILNKNNSFNKLVNQTTQLLGEDDLKRFISNEDKSDLLDLLSGLASRNYEYFDMPMVLHAEGNVKVDTICFVRGLYGELGKFTEAVVTFQDVTESVKNRIELEESEKRFRVIVENATEALLLLDFDSLKYIDVNNNAEELFGYSRKELLNLEFGDLSPLNQFYGISSELSKINVKKALDGENVVYEWTILRKDNKLIPCEVRMVKLPFKGSNIVRTSVIDITDRKKAEKLLNQEKQKLEETNKTLVNLNDKLANQTKQLQDFAYISSHNLRSPAVNIRALLDFYNNDPNQANFNIMLEKLDVVSVDLLDTINDLAEVVKIKNEIAQEVGELSLIKLLVKAKDSLSQKISEKHGEIILNLNGIEYIRSSKTYMDSKVLNLLSNAVKYAREGIPPIIEVVAKETETNFVLSVKDNGLGLDLKRHGDKVFGLRRTFHRNFDSRGVGLFITKAQVEALEGTITMDSTPNVGSTFTIKLPKQIIIS